MLTSRSGGGRHDHTPGDSYIGSGDTNIRGGEGRQCRVSARAVCCLLFIALCVGLRSAWQHKRADDAAIDHERQQRPGATPPVPAAPAPILRNAPRADPTPTVELPPHMKRARAIAEANAARAQQQQPPPQPNVAPPAAVIAARTLPAAPPAPVATPVPPPAAAPATAVTAAPAPGSLFYLPNSPCPPSPSLTGELAAFASLLCRVVGPDHLVVMAESNSGFHPLTMNWVWWARHHNLTNHVVVALDEAEYARLQAKRVPSFYFTSHKFSDAVHYFRTPLYNDIVAFKHHLVSVVLELGFHVMLMDVDTVILKNFFPDLPRTLPLCDFYGTADANFWDGHYQAEVFYNSVNTGVVLFRNTPKTKWLMREVVTYIAAKKQAGASDPESGFEDQYHFNKWLGNLRVAGQSVDRQKGTPEQFAAAPHCFDYSGLTFYMWHHLDFSNGMHKFDPNRRVLLHANMVQGVTAKRKRLIEDGLWHGDELASRLFCQRFVCVRTMAAAKEAAAAAGSLVVPHTTFDSKSDLIALSKMLDLLPRRELTFAYSFTGEKVADRPKSVHFAAAHNGADALALKWWVDELYQRAVNAEPQSPVWEDSCVEFFVRSSAAGAANDYFNFEISAIGTVLAHRGAVAGVPPAQRTPQPLAVVQSLRIHSSLGTAPFAERKAAGPWELTALVPSAAFGCAQLCDATDVLCNVYKCADGLKLGSPHYLSLFAVATDRPNFHRPDSFRPMTFLPAAATAAATDATSAKPSAAAPASAKA